MINNYDKPTINGLEMTIEDLLEIVEADDEAAISIREYLRNGGAVTLENIKKWSDETLRRAKEKKLLAYKENVMAEKLYMNIHTGSVDTYDGWDYENEDGEIVNGVDRGEVVEVVEIDGDWVEVE